MGSDGGGGGDPSALMRQASPMPNIPIAGGEGTVTNPFDYGKFQNFLPDVPSAEDFAKGVRAPSATGLNKEMFDYKSPSGGSLRDQLAAAVAGGAGGAGGVGGVGGAGGAGGPLGVAGGAGNAAMPPWAVAGGNPGLQNQFPAIPYGFPNLIPTAANPNPWGLAGQSAAGVGEAGDYGGAPGPGAVGGMY